MIFVQFSGLELVAQNLSRLDEENDQDAEGVHNSLSIIENVLEFDNNYINTLCEKTCIIEYLVLRCKRKLFDGNKLYCSEVLLMLIQSHEKCIIQLGNLESNGSDGIDLLLQCISIYRKKEIKLTDEQECFENLFLCLCGASDSKLHTSLRRILVMTSNCTSVQFLYFAVFCKDLLGSL